VQNVYNHPVDDFCWPSVWGWKVVDMASLVSSIDQRINQNGLKNLLPQSKAMDCGIPKCTHTRSKKSLAVAYAMIFFLLATIMVILENLSMTMKTQPLSCLV